VIPRGSPVDEGGAFDDLLPPREELGYRDTKPENFPLEAPSKRRPSTQSEREVAALIGQALDACTPGHAVQRGRTCCRCESLADAARKAGGAVPPVQQAESWKRDGRTYTAGLCWDCNDFEWSARWQVSYDAADKRGDTGAMTALVERVQYLAKAGRRFRGTWRGAVHA
jgi:hypothetical protein